MKVLDIAYYTVLKNFRDRKTLALMLLLPIVLILILGSALSGVFTPGNISRTAVCYLNEDRGILGERFDEYLQNEEIGKFIETKKVSSYEAGIQLVKDRGASSFIHIDKDFTEKTLKGEVGQIHVFNSQYSSFRATVVKNIVDSFIDGANTITALNKVGISNAAYTRSGAIEEMPISVTGKTPRSIDYYAVTMMVMTIMYGTAYGCSAMAEDQVKKTFIRLKGAPIKAWEVNAGKITGSIITILMQVIILIAFTKYAYNVNWGGNIPFILLVCFSMAILSVGLGIMVYNIFGNPHGASAFLSTLVMILTFISGGYFPTDALSPIFAKVSLLSPNYLAQRAIFNTVFSGAFSETLTYFGIIWAIIITTFIVAAWAGRRANYDNCI